MAKPLAHDLGVEAADFANLWREKQLEYSFRRDLPAVLGDASSHT